MKNLIFILGAIVLAPVLTLTMATGCVGSRTNSAPTPEWAVSERLVAEIDYSSWIPDSIVVSP